MKPAVQIIQRLYASPYFRIITILLFSGFLLYTNFCVNNYSTYPFYYNGDPDAYYAAPSIILANGGYLFSTIHPDGTAFSLYGGIYRVLSLFSEQHGLLNHFENIKSQYEAVKVLTAAVLSGRIISLVVIFFSVIFMSLILYHVTKHNYLIALSFSLCATTMPSVLLYTHILRADHISILFFVFGLSIIMLLYKTNIASLARYLLFYLLAGVMFGFAILAKIQIMPLVFSCILFIFTFELIFNRDNIPNTFNDLLIANIAVAALAAVIFPWWGLTKPRYLTHSFYTSLGFDFHRLYGNLPDKIISPVVIICALLLLIPISLYFFRLISQSKIIERLSVVCLIGNVVCLGIIISSYLVLVPVSSSFETYIHNTRHLIYSTVLQVFNTLTGYGGYLEHIDGISIGWFQKFTSIISQHGANSPLAGINLLYFVALSLAVCLYRLIFRKKEITWKFFIPIYLFITAFFMDYLSAMRLSKFLLYFHYMIFSIFIYVFGIFYTFYLECYGAGRSLNSPDLGFSWVLLSKRGFVYSLVVIYFAVYLGQLSFPSPSLAVSQPPYAAWGMIGTYCPQFQEWIDLNNKFVFSKIQHDKGYNIYFNTVSQPLKYWNLGLNNVKNAPNTSLPSQIKKASSNIPTQFAYPSIGKDARGFNLGRLGDNNVFEQISVSVWFQIDKFPIGEQQIFGSTKPPELNLGLTVYGGGIHMRKLYGYYGVGNNDGSLTVTSNKKILPNVWYNALLVKDTTGLHLYLDGKKIGSTMGNASSIFLSELGCNYWKYGNISNMGQFTVASVVLWDKALSEEQIEVLYDMQHGLKHFSKEESRDLTNSIYF